MNYALKMEGPVRGTLELLKFEAVKGMEADNGRWLDGREEGARRLWEVEFTMREEAGGRTIGRRRGRRRGRRHETGDRRQEAGGRRRQVTGGRRRQGAGGRERERERQGRR
jgi:hypothetical protein